MSKSLFLACIIAMLSCTASAQQKTQQYVLSLSIGPSFPLGRFSAGPSWFPQGDSGNAVTGGAAHLLLEYRLKNKVGISLLIGGTINGQNKDRLQGSLREELGQDAVINVYAKSWQAFEIMPGISYNIRLSSDGKLELQPMLSAGVCKTAVPAQSYAYHTNDLSGSNGSISVSKNNLPASFCYRFSAGLHYNISQNIFCLTNLSYFNSNPVATYGYSNDWTTPGNWVTARNHYSLSSIGVQVGVGARF